MISQPQAGILGTYAIVKRPWVITDENGADAIAIRSIMNLTLTYDHRLVDGALAGRLPARPARTAADLGRERLLGRRTSSTSASSTTARHGSCSARSPQASRDGSLPDTVLFLEHPPTITLGRRTEAGEVHVPEGADVEVVEVDRGGKSTYHAPGQLVCYPIFDLTRHGQDVKRYCRELEEALVRTLAAFGLAGTRIEGLTGVWLESPPRKIASIGIHITSGSRPTAMR